MRTGWAWGAAAVVVWSGLARAQVPNAGSGPTTDPAAAPTTPTPTPPMEATPAPSVTPAAPPAAQAAPDGDEDEGEEAPKPKRQIRWHEGEREADESEGESENEGEGEGEAQAEAEPPVAASGFRLGGPHFVLSIERATSVLAWSQSWTEGSDASSPIPGGLSKLEVEESGTTVAFLGAGTTNPFAIPRVAFDGMFANGLTLGGSIGYTVTTGEHEETRESSSAGASTSKLPGMSIFVLAPRLGVFIPTSQKVAIWLRGGITRVVATLQEERRDPNTNAAITRETTTTLVDVTLEPQLVIAPVPHVGLSLGGTLDVGVAGTIEQTTGTNSIEVDTTATAYGVTAGLVALF